MMLLTRLISSFVLNAWSRSVASSFAYARTTLSLLGMVAMLAACGGGGGGSSASTSTNTSGASTSSANSNASTTSSATTTATALASNAVAISVGNAIGGRRPNLPYVSVTVCVPNTTTCQTIDDVIVDTGSVGLRLLASSLTVGLTMNTAPSGAALGECVQFADGYTWGAVRTADIKVGSETASAVPVNVIADSATPTMPSACADNGGVAHSSISSLGANGILGIGQQSADCGTACANAAVPMTYYACNGSNNGTCVATQLSLAQQVPNPISRFATDNNGSVIVFPAVDAQGVANVAGQLIFGIGTQSNNALGTATVIPTDVYGQFTATVNSHTFSKSYLDSGSNSIYFSGISIPTCSSNAAFYCPTAALNYGMVLTSNIGTATLSSTLNINNAETMLSANGGTGYALPGLAGPGFTTGLDLGLPFFYGKRVFTAIAGAVTPGGTGPYIAI